MDFQEFKRTGTIITPGLHGRLVTLLFIFLVASTLFLIFVPWRQTVVGSGEVTSFSPDARPQTVESVISGRIVRWFVREGSVVKKGDTIVVLADINVNFMDVDMLSRLDEVRRGTSLSQQQGVEVAKQRRQQAQQRLSAAVARVANVSVELTTASIRALRADTLFKQDLVSRRDLETAQLNLQRARLDSATAKANLESAAQDVALFTADLQRAENQASIALQEIDLRLANAQIRKGASYVVAPADGIVVRIAKVGNGQIVKEGDELALIVPRTDDRAVELHVGDMDAALIEPGRLVSLQFSGFPAFQFSGWQNINVGIFHGRVKVVDAVDDKTGRFRVLVVPATPEYSAWPSNRFLRQGATATGWILLDQVSIGYELWRQLMGFPPQFPAPTKVDYTTPDKQESTK
ncbi:MAG: HlyD family secretion protein [Ignavibacteria bacterium]|jgi:adhesin transport system membrane fusion protein